MSKFFRCCVFVAVLIAAASVPANAGEVKLSLNNGLVTLSVTDEPLSRVLAEWARLGQTRIVNGEKLTGMLTLELVDVPEKKALDILLRSASGYVAAERRTPVAGASAFDRVMILPFSQAPAYTPMPAAQMPPQPFINRPVAATPEFEEPQPLPNAPQQPGNVPLTLPQPGAMPQTPGMMPQMPMPVGQPAPITAPRPGFLPPPGPPRPGGGGGQ